MKLRELTKRNKRDEAFSAFVCLLPAILLAVVFIFIPIIFVFYLSFTDWDLTRVEKNLIGVKNFSYLFTNQKFQKSIVNTFYFACAKIPLDLILALFLAVLLDKQIKGRRFFRAAYFAPVITPLVASSLIWIWLFDPSFGPLNLLLGFFGLKPIPWLFDQHWAMPSVILFSLWQGLGYDVVIFLAGLQGIPPVYTEAAVIDGANSRQAFFRITLPILSPVLYFVILIGIINSFKIFTQIAVMTPDGGPLYSTGVMVFYIYQLAFVSFRIGRASAAAVILFLLILALTAIQRRAGKKYVQVE
ncbi:MAG: sugar ABC transporter permease [Spirochaetota bacterium]